MRILVHDFGAYSFAAQLSRTLARRGHEVRHAYCGSLQTTPQGAMTPHPDDPETLTFEAVTLPEPLEKYRFVTRWRQERAYGRLAAGVVDRFQPDVVLSANMPLDAQQRLLRRCRKQDVRFVFWLQDLIGVAAQRLLRGRFLGAGTLVGYYYARLERRLLRASDAVVGITEDFRPLLREMGLGAEAVHIVENWAPLEEVPLRPKANAWAAEHGLTGKRVLLYSGTLGMKHNPELLLRLARHFQHEEDVRVVVVSQGLGADWLARQREEHDLSNLVLLGFQPYARMPEVLGSADVLLAVLEPDAGVFSVPSKALTYLCAARPLLLAVPPANLAARIVRREDAGTVVAPTDADAFVDAAAGLLLDAEARDRMGRNARNYAERAFDIDAIADRFEAVLLGR
jgi:glycosyltransferase involved in cell wall biosynthesis